MAEMWAVSLPLAASHAARSPDASGAHSVARADAPAAVAGALLEAAAARAAAAAAARYAAQPLAGEAC